MTPDAVNAYFTPLDYFFYLTAVLVVMAVWSQYKWAKICRNNVLVLVQRTAGAGDFVLAPQQGGTVTLEHNKRKQMWVMSDLNTIDVPYPGVGFIPAQLQKTIRLIVVSEVDWEPITNRDPNREMIGSPEFLNNVINERVSALAITVAKDVMDPLNAIIKRFRNTVSATLYYIGTGLTLVLLAYLIYQLVPLLGDILVNQAAIMKAVGAVNAQLTP